MIDQEIEDFNSLIEYVELLFEEKQYLKAGKIW